MLDQGPAVVPEPEGQTRDLVRLRHIEFTMSRLKVDGVSKNFVVPKPGERLPRHWCWGSIFDEGKRVKVWLPPDEWRRLLESDRRERTIILDVGGLVIRGRVSRIMPDSLQRCPKGWVAARLPSLRDPEIPIRISPDDYFRIMRGTRRVSVATAWKNARKAHIQYITNIETLKMLERRVQALRNCSTPYLPKPMVDAGLLNQRPTREQWSKLEENADGEISYESLARAGLLTEFGIAAPNVPLGPYEGPPEGFSVFPAKVLDEYDLACAEDLKRAVEAATRPYRKARCRPQCFLEGHSIDCATPIEWP